MAYTPPPAPRGTQRYDPNVGYAGGAFNDPNAWASDEDYRSYQAAQAPSAGGGGVSSGGAPAPVAVQNFATNPQGTQVTGQGTVGQGAYEGQQQTQLESQLGDQRMELAAKLQQQAEARRLGYLSTVKGDEPTVTRGNIATNETGARNAAFARAKETAGQTANASLKALSDVMASRGMTGSSVEGAATADIIGGAAEGTNQFTRDQLIQDLNRAADISDQEYQGGITQRGQNLSMVPSLMGLITAGGGLY